VERQGQKTVLLVTDANRAECRLTLGGDVLDFKAGPGSGPRPRSDRYGTGRFEIGRSGEATLVREADRILALGPDGQELWRYQVPAAEPAARGARRPQVGLPLLSSPHLVRWKDREFVVCGVGQRTVMIGMGIHYRPLGGGVLALNTDGTKLYQGHLGYCEEIVVVERRAAPPVAVGLFVRVTPGENRYRPDQQPFLVALAATTGRELWRAEFPKVKDRYYARRPDEEKLHVAGGGGVPVFVIVNGDDATLFGLDGKRAGEIDGVWVVAAVDLDSDGQPEVLGYRKKQRYRQCGRLVIASPDGRTLWTGPEGNWEYHGAVDLDGDGWLEVLAIRSDGPRTVAVFGMTGRPSVGAVGGEDWAIPTGSTVVCVLWLGMPGDH
jgi:hypothetical protein